jgi:hypothetical protein
MLDMLYQGKCAFPGKQCNGYLCGWGYTPDDMKEDTDGDEARYFMVMHTFTWMGKEPWPGCKEPKAPAIHKLAKKMFPELRFLIIGDNHTPYEYSDGGLTVISPGSMTRQSADQKDHKPSAVLVNIHRNTCERLYFDIDPSAVTSDHIDIVNVRDQRIQDFINTFNDSFDLSLSLRGNLDNFYRENQVSQGVRDAIEEALQLARR